MSVSVRAIAFYLPQYHPIPENDLWWGKGFTEWSNVTKAKPLFSGHYQPHLPADLGFYDLRVSEVREQQAELAREAGIEGFCYYHYWFNGRRLLNRPFDEVLDSGKPDFPFCLCWANESWQRNWDNCNGDVLIKQAHDPQNDLDHIRWLCNAFRDHRYIRVDGKPLILIYRSQLINHIQEMLAKWREEAVKQGIGELYICRVESMRQDRDDCRNSGFDAAVEFQPDWEITAHIRYHLKQPQTFIKRLRRKIQKSYAAPKVQSPFLVSYKSLIDAALAKPNPPYVRHPCVVPTWDNTARKGMAGLVLEGVTPELFRYWMKQTVKRVSEGNNPKLVFINAWNEWAEGCHLEPCLKWGHSFLEVCRDVLGARKD